VFVVTVGLMALGFTPALAQEGGVVTGVVLESRAQRPLPGAQISLAGTGLGSLVNGQGRFLLVNVPVGTHTLRVQIIGYRTQERSITVPVGQTVVENFVLDFEALGLDEIIVTGTVGTIQKRAVANVVGTLTAVEQLERTAPISVQQMLAGQVPGVSVQIGTGSAGSGGGIQIRGRSSVAINAQPLLYIDGVRANGSVGGFGAFASSGTSRLNDLNPEDIERIEIIKGPAAATLYGTEASAGVIQVITKRGRPGPAVVDVMVRQGTQWFNDPGGRLPTNYAAQSDGSIISQHPYKDEIAAGRNPFKTGLVESYQVSVRGGLDNLTYFFSGGYDNEEGFARTDSKDRQTVRANVQSSITDRIDVSIELGVIRSERHTGRDIDWGVIATHQFGSPNTRGTPLRGFSGAPPEITALRDWTEKLNRGTVSATATHRPTSWLTQRLVWGVDFTDAQQTRFTPRFPDTEEFSYYSVHSSEGRGLGAKYSDEKRDLNRTLDYNLTASFEPTSELTAATSFGMQYFTRSAHVTSAQSSQLPTSAVSTVSSGSVRSGGETFVENKTFGVFVQETIGWRDQLFVTAAVRADANSAFGESFDAAYYPKLSASWVISDTDFFDVSAIETLRLRAAWGRSGQQPDAFAAVRTYAPSVGPGNVPTVTPGAIGNPDLKPEVGTELEVGFDASLFNALLDLEVTHYRTVTKDAILMAPSAPSGGFSAPGFVNAGQVDNTGFEFGLNVRPIQTPSFGFSLGLTASQNEGILTSNGGLPALQIDRRGRFQHIEGYPLGSNWSRYVASANWDGTSLANIMCEGAPGEGLNFAQSERGGGSPVSCGNAPYFYVGQAQAEWFGSLTPQLTFGNSVRVSALFSWVFNRYRFSTTQWKRDNSFGNSLQGAESRNGTLDPILAASFLTAGVEWPHHQREDHFRMRDVSVSYNLPAGWVENRGASRATIMVTGRNLWMPYTHSSFTDLDPETKHTRDREYGWQLNPLPLPHTVVVTMRVTF